ncbi:hypothetical protein [Bradyrhizobium genosp. P]|uniref:hypothetical protein n=1 Tax=Bradyrhizobium genosp. P TaxID=83641 RepID=UPI003CED820E
MSYSSAKRSTTPQEHAEVTPPPDPAIDQIKQTLSSLQQSVHAVQSDQQKLEQKLSAQINDIQQKQGDSKLLSDQLGALSARVDSLESAKAEAPAAPQPAPTQQRARRTRR